MTHQSQLSVADSLLENSQQQNLQSNQQNLQDSQISGKLSSPHIMLQKMRETIQNALNNQKSRDDVIEQMEIL
jgi:hypothetical protein